MTVNNHLLTKLQINNEDNKNIHLFFALSISNHPSQYLWHQYAH